MSNPHPIQSVLETALAKIRDVIDSETIIGDPITLAEGAVVIPVSKVSFGFASGGSDLPTKTTKELFGGGAGAGVSIKPVAFITFCNGEIKLMRIDENEPAASALLGKLPETIEKLQATLGKKKKGAEETSAE
ncbi:MAG: GerW family sporulation protein [Oscillospiraceae bacterium]|nr:GerW family sporulation protein [Oscillospiraceae bacterium]